MGIKGLMKLLADNAPNCMKQQKFDSYFNRKIAIDASMSIYQILYVVGGSGTQVLKNEAGEVSSHLQWMFFRSIRLLEAGIKPVSFENNTGVKLLTLGPLTRKIAGALKAWGYVFDGEPPDLKKEQLNKSYSIRADATEDLSEAIEKGDKEGIEKFSKQTVKLTRPHNNDCMKLLGLMGIPVVEAPSEAEAQCAALCKHGKVYAVASEDMDTLTFGASRFVRHLMDPRFERFPVMEFEMAKVLEELNLTMDQFIDLCILSGCDYCVNIKGIAGLTALKLIRQHGCIETILEYLKNEGRYQIADDWPYQEVRKLFKEPLVFPENEEPELKWGPPDEEGLVNFLVNENSFNVDRVIKAIERIKSAKNKLAQRTAESFVKPVATADSVPINRKEPKDASLKETAKREQNASDKKM